MRGRLLVLGLLLLCSGVSVAQQGSRGNPSQSSEDAAAGSRLFRSHCSRCHGERGEGGFGPNLVIGRFRQSSGDAELFTMISEGIPGTEMPGVFFQGKQVWQLVAYVQSLRAGSGRTPSTGDPARGEGLFRGKGGCLQCHLVSGEGGRLGPELSDIGARRSLRHLRTSLLQPSEAVLPLYWRVDVVTLDGKRISGRRLNEDTLSLQLLDSQENLVSVLKSETEKAEYDRTSAMPSYASLLSESELEDVVAYLATLTRKRATP